MTIGTDPDFYFLFLIYCGGLKFHCDDTAGITYPQTEHTILNVRQKEMLRCHVSFYTDAAVGSDVANLF